MVIVLWIISNLISKYGKPPEQHLTKPVQYLDNGELKSILKQGDWVAWLRLSRFKIGAIWQIIAYRLSIKTKPITPKIEIEKLHSEKT